MNQYMLGTTVRLSLTFSQNGAGDNPTTQTLEVRAPDGTTTTPTLISDGVGAYHSDYATTQAGVHYYYATGTGFTNLPSAEVAQESSFFVTDSKVLHP